MSPKCPALFGRPHTPGLGPALQRVAECIRQTLPQAQILMESQTAADAGTDLGLRAASISQIEAEADLAIVLGGDGTLLGIARQLAPRGIPLIGVNQGRLGFMTDLDIADLDTALPPLLRGEGTIEERQMLSVRVLRRRAGQDPTAPAQVVFEAQALNDAVVSRGSVSRMVELDVFVGDHYVQSLRADGLIVSTPTGSTAYALSASGSILHPALAAIILVPVAPQALSSRPIVLPAEAEVTVVVQDGAGTELHCDMQALTALADGDEIVVGPSPHRVRLLHPKGQDYFSMLRRKLQWSANPTHLGRPDPIPPAR